MTTTTRVTVDPGEAVACLLRGGIVAIPTETVYGLAALVTDRKAIRRVFEAKGRPTDHPLIIHASGLEMARHYGDVAGAAALLARRFWPGPMTLVVERTPLVADVVTGGRDTVALRVPDHPLALMVIEACGQGLVAPSANLFGHVSPTTADHVLSDLDGRIDMVLDGGSCRVGVESTIIECTDGIQVLRPGQVTVRDIESCSGMHVTPATGPSRAPGMLRSHYAPAARVILAESEDEARERAAELSGQGRSVRIVGSGLGPAEYAADLYRLLREADDAGTGTIVALLPPGDGIATAVRDRLHKAAADTSGSAG